MAEFDPDAFKNWTPQAQAKAAEMLQEFTEPPKMFYCRRGRQCDGEPHEGAPYKHARGYQWPPPSTDPWRYWVLICGRGWGKTLTGANFIRKMTEHAHRLAIVGQTTEAIRDTMVEGETGILSVCRAAGFRPEWEPSKKILTFPNGAIVKGYTAEEPDRLRGANTSVAWLDEPAFFPDVDYVWKMLKFGMRIKGVRPRVAITTTPTPSDWIKEMVEDPKAVLVRGSTFDNESNLDEDFVAEMREKYDGTRIGRQELYGEILEDVEGALWNTELIDRYRLKDESPLKVALEMTRIVIAVDPAGTSLKRSDETGIMVMGVVDNEIFLLEDASGKYTPNEWARKVDALREKYQADAVVAENNYGGEMVASVLENAGLPLKPIMVNSRRGKLIRAEPVHTVYERGRFHHVGQFEKLERQLTTWIPGSGKSPDRLDALVHGAHELIDMSPPAQAASPAARASRLRAVSKGVSHKTLGRQARRVR